MLFYDLNTEAQANAERNVFDRVGNDKETAELIANDYFLFDMNGEIIEEQDNY